MTIHRGVKRHEVALCVGDVCGDPRVEHHLAWKQRIGDEGAIPPAHPCAARAKSREVRLPALLYDAAHGEPLSAG